MTSPNLYKPPEVFTLPLVKDQDLVVDFMKTDSAGAFVNYDPDESVHIVLDTNPPTTAEAVIEDHHAVVRVESEVTDLIARPVGWRCVASTAGSPSTETVPCNGKTQRFDG